MFEMLPNWHPVAVHFPIALVMTATLLLLAAKLRPANTLLPASARLLLAFAALTALLAVGLGWHAFLTVEHDAAGHLLMLRHRNWAQACSGALLLLALWDAWRQRAGQLSHAALLPAMLLLSGGLVFTAWLGGEMVYRHGVGVLPSAFAAPPAPSAAPPAVETPSAQAPVAEPAAASGEHIHKDGKRHHH